MSGRLGVALTKIGKNGAFLTPFWGHFLTLAKNDTFYHFDQDLGQNVRV